MDPKGNVTMYNENGESEPSAKDLEQLVSMYIESFKDKEEIKITEKFLSDFANQVTKQIKFETDFINEEGIERVSDFSIDFRNKSSELQKKMSEIEKHLDTLDDYINNIGEKIRYIDKKLNKFIIDKEKDK